MFTQAFSTTTIAPRQARKATVCQAAPVNKRREMMVQLGLVAGLSLTGAAQAFFVDVDQYQDRDLGIQQKKADVKYNQQLAVLKEALKAKKAAKKSASG